MKNLLIVGAGGAGRDTYNLALDCQANNDDFRIKGFLDDNSGALDGFVGYKPVINSIDDYKILKDDVFVVAIGDVQIKKIVTKKLIDKGVEFYKLIHPLAIIAHDAKIGKGCVIMQNAFFGSKSSCGDFVLVQISAVVGHDVTIGNYCRIDCHVVLVGGIILRDDVTIHTSAVVNQKVTVEKGANVGACSFVIRNVKENTTVYGNPARKL